MSFEFERKRTKSISEHLSTIILDTVPKLSLRCL